MPTTTEDPSWVEAWTAALDDLELSVVGAERLLHGDADILPAWTPPSLPGPLPASLEERARALLSRQHEAAGALAQAALGTRRQRAITRQVGEATRPASRPAYLDVTA